MFLCVACQDVIGVGWSHCSPHQGLFRGFPQFPSSHDPFLSHSTLTPWKLLRLVMRGFELAQGGGGEALFLICGLGTSPSPSNGLSFFALKPERLGCSLRMGRFPMLHQTPSLPTLSSSDRAWPACCLESCNQPRNLVDKAKGRVSTGKKQLAGIIVVDKKWKYISVSYVSPAPLSGDLWAPASGFCATPRSCQCSQE